MKKVLVIGSDAPTFDAFQEFLSPASDIESVDYCENGRDGFQKAEALKPDFVFIDVVTPDMDSVELLRLVREQLPDIKVVMMSRSNDVHWLRRCIVAGAHNLMSIPFLKADLIDLLILLDANG